MVQRGHIKNGQIVLDQPVRLPEDAQVNVQVLDKRIEKTSRRRELLRLPLEQRHQLLREQAERMASRYEVDEDRIEWQGGDIIE